MKKIPNMIFIIDTNVEDIAVKEALKLNIPIVAIVDTNSNPTGINFPIPGNDDARRAINLYCELVKKTILDAQQNISTKDSDETKPTIKTEESKSKQKMEKVKSGGSKPEIKTKGSKPKGKTPTVEKKTTSIFSKIKKLASKKSK